MNHLRGLRVSVLGASVAAVIALAGCGEDDFENLPRPPSPVELTAAIDKDSVTVAPRDIGAGLVTITISNQTDEATKLVLDGPTAAESPEIPPMGTASIKTRLDEGDYEASAGASIGIEPMTISVGPERDSSQNDLLLP